jgi:hypothetical protein
VLINIVLIILLWYLVFHTSVLYCTDATGIYEYMILKIIESRFLRFPPLPAKKISRNFFFQKTVAKIFHKQLAAGCNRDNIHFSDPG